MPTEWPSGSLYSPQEARRSQIIHHTVLCRICLCLYSHFPYFLHHSHQEEHIYPCLKLCAVENLNKLTRQFGDSFEAEGDECGIENHLLYFGGTLATSCEELTHWKRLWCWEGLGAGGEGDDRGWDGWMASLTRWTWIWVNSGSWWWTGRPGVLRFMGSQTVGHEWVTELNWTEVTLSGSSTNTYTKKTIAWFIQG